MLFAATAKGQTNYGVDIFTGPDEYTLASNLYLNLTTLAGQGYKVWFVADVNGDGVATNVLRTGLVGGDNYLLHEGFLDTNSTTIGLGNYFNSLFVDKQFTNANIYVYIWNSTNAAEAASDGFGILSLGTNLPPLFGNAQWLINAPVYANQFYVLPFSTNIWNFNNTGDWSDSGNWQSGTVPVSSSTNLLIFGGTADYTANNDLGDFILNVLEFNNSAGTVQLTGNTLILTNEFGTPEIGLLGAGNATISNGVRLEANLNIVGDGSGTLNLAGTVSGTGNVFKTGSHTLLLGGSNTFTGLFTMAGGTLLVGNDDAFGANTLRLNGGTIASADSSTRQIANQLVIAGDPVFGQGSGGTGTLDFQGGINLGGINTRILTVNNPQTIFSGVVSNGGFTKQGSGSLVLSAANTLAGNITLADGALLIGNASALGSGAININGGTLASSSGTGYTLANNVIVGGDFTMGQPSGGTGTLNLAGGINFGFASRTISISNSLSIISGNIGNGRLIKAGSGALQLSGNNTFGNGVILNQGTLLVGSAGALNATDNALQLNAGTIASADSTARTIANDVTFGGDVTIGQVSGGTGALNFSGSLNLGGAIRTITVDSPSATFSGDLDNGGITKAGSGTLVLSGANTFTDGLAVDAGTVSVSSDSNLGDPFSGVVLNGGTLRSTGSFTWDPVRGITVDTAGGAIEVTGISTLTQGGALSGTGTLSKTGPGLLVLTNDNTGFTGKIAINAGTLSVNRSQALGAVPGSPTADQLTFNGGTLRWTASGSNEVQRGFTLGAAGGTIEVNSNINFTNHSVITGSGDLTKSGAGTLFLRPGVGNTYSGRTIVAGGALNITNVSAFGVAPLSFVADQIVVSNDARLAVAGNTDLGANRGLTMGAGGGRLDVAGNTTLTVQTVSGSDVLIKTNTGTNVFLVDNSGTFSGPVLMHNGIIRVGADNALGTGTIYFTNQNNSRLANNNASVPVTLGNDLVFNTNAILGQASTAPLNLTGTMTLAEGLNRSLQVDSAVTNSGGVIGSGGLVKVGGGVLELTGANTYAGGTAVTNGTLALTGAGGVLTATPGIYVDRTRTLQLGAAYGGDNADRIGAIPVTLNGGNLNVLNSTVDVSESIGALVLPSNRSVVTLTPAAGTQIDLNPSSLVRSPGTLLFVRGTNLGSAAGPDTARLTFGTAPTLIGGGGGAGSANISIAPYIAVGTNNGNTFGLATFVTHDANGLRPLTDSEYFTATTDISGAGTTDNVSLTGTATTVTMGGDKTINALRHVSTTAKTINGAGQTLTITSGGIIVTNANLTINAGVNFGANEGIINLPQGGADRILTINGPLMGSAGLILTAEGTGDRLDLRGTNSQFSGTIYIHGGQLRLLGPLAVSRNNDLFMSGGFFRLNTNNVEIGSLRGETGTIDNGTAGFSRLTINQKTFGQFNGSISNSGTAGAILGVTKKGLAELALGGVNPFTGDFLINEGVVRLNGAGGVSSTNVVINSRGTLIVDNSNNNNNRLRDAGTGIAVRMHGGTLQFTGGLGGTSSESMGDLVLGSGASSINTARANLNQDHSRTFASLQQTPGATINFVDNNLGDDNRNRIVFTTAPTLDDGIIGGWATAGNEFATYVNSGTISVNLLGTHQTGPQTAWVATDNVKMTAATDLTGDRTINSLTMSNANATLGLGGFTLTIDSGGLISSGGSKAITNGTLTTPGNYLYVHVLANNLTNSAVIADGTGGAVQLVKSGTGLLRLTNDNTFTGGVRVNQGTLEINSDGQLGAVPGAFDADNIILDGGVLRAIGTTLVHANRGVQLGANGDNAYGILDANTGTFSIMGVISGGTSNPLVARGGATLVLANTANTYAGGTIISNITLRVVADGSFGATPAVFDANNIVFDAGTLQFSNSMTLGANRGLVLRGAGGTVANLNFNVQNAEHVVNLTATNVSLGAGATVTELTRNGNGTLVWTGLAPAAPLWNGRTRLDAGTNAIDHINKLGSGELIIDGGALRATGSFDLSSKQVLISTNNDDNATFTVDAGQTLTINSVIANLHSNAVSAGGLIKRGDGTLVLGATNVYGGNTFIVDGTLSVTVNEALGSQAQGTNVVLLSNPSGRNAGMATNLVLRNGTLLLNGTTQTVRAVTLAERNADTLAGSHAAIEGPGRLILQNNIAYLAGPGDIAGSAHISADLDLNGADRSITVSNGVDAVDLMISGAILNGGSGGPNARNLTKSGAGTLVLSNTTATPNLYSNTIVTRGTLMLGASEQLPNLRLLEIQNATFDLAGYTETIGALTLGNAAGALPIVNINGGLLTNNGTLTYNAASLPGTARITGGTYSLGGGNRTFAINDSGSVSEELIIDATVTSDNQNRTLTKTGAGVLVFSNAVAHANNWGPLTIQGGTVKLGLDGQLPDTRTVTVESSQVGGGTLDLNGRNETIGALSLGGGAATPVFGATVADSAGGGLLTLGGNVTYNTGPSSNHQGQATISANLSLGGATRTFTINNSTNAAVDLLVSGNISGTGVGLIKAGAGLMALSGNNTFSGPATVNAGVLALAGDGALGAVSAVNLNGGTLAISGSGTLNRVSDTAPVTLNGGAIYLDDTGASGFTETLGALTLTANSVIDFGTLNNSSLVLTFGDSSANVWTAGQFLNVYNWSGAWSPVSGGSAGGPDQLHFDASGLTAGQLAQIRFYSDAGTTFLGLGMFIGTEVVPTPEPATWVSLGALAALLGWRERRRLAGAVRGARRRG
jgi:autotransporter-associated beta strand protein